ncbi:DUF3570 domain-containing protein [Ferrimonas balearica]|uniref:DUF3570 domain-containing protein n=1 Tax=Ferrimonas balearica TaxID=44012 RepID=UPI001F259041|nr:DUF3570 domain-containing protein [Ferrimonas balearica]MBY6095309.1 DUF3570 domain-containing protein [Ferrimonas balearica]
MQLSRERRFTSISGSLMIASQALVAPAQADWFDDDAQWRGDAALLYYGEDGDRVTALEGTLQLTRLNADEQQLSFAATFDSLTGATPTGAVPQNTVQTFTRPSGRGEYAVTPGDTPLDDTFRDTRVQLNVGWSSALNTDWDYDLGAHLSKEYDYTSLGFNGGAVRYFDRKNTALRLGSALFFDTIEPEGRAPLPLTAMPLRDDFATEAEFAAAFAATRGNAKEHKQTAELTLGLTQVINPWMVTQFNYSYALVDGYQTDAFKLVSVVDGDGVAQRHLYEARPDQRNKHAVFWQTKAHFGAPVLDVSYRFMTDDWDIDSHTLDLRLNWQFSNGHNLEPHLRLYRQSAAEFYRPYLMDGAPLPEYASADYRLAEMDTYTIGLKYALPLGEHQASVRLEYYLQQPDGPTGPGQLAELELYPEVQAVILQLAYRF